MCDDGCMPVAPIAHPSPVESPSQDADSVVARQGQLSLKICPVINANQKPWPNCRLRLFFRDGRIAHGSWTGEIWISGGREVHPERWQIDLPLGFGRH